MGSVAFRAGWASGTSGTMSWGWTSTTATSGGLRGPPRHALESDSAGVGMPGLKVESDVYKGWYFCVARQNVFPTY